MTPSTKPDDTAPAPANPEDEAERLRAEQELEHLLRNPQLSVPVAARRIEVRPPRSATDMQLIDRMAAIVAGPVGRALRAMGGEASFCVSLPPVW